MAGNKGAVTILAILAFAGLGLSGYMFIDDRFLTEEFVDTDTDTQGFLLVGLWNNLHQNFDSFGYQNDQHFLIEYDEQMVLDTNYVNIINETCFTLPTAGLYKINLNVLISGLTDINGVYWVTLLGNDTSIGYFDRFETANPVISSYHYISSSVYLNNTDGDSIYRIYAYSTEGFGVSVSDPFNQLSIEYIFS